MPWTSDRRKIVMRSAWLLCAVVLPAVVRAQRPAARALPRWEVDSSVDEMTDQKIVWAELRAVRPVAYQWGTFTPVLAVVCFTQPEFGDGLALRLISEVSPSFGSVASGKAARITLRFDSTEARDVRFTVENVGGGAAIMEPRDLLWRTAGAIGSGHEARDTLLARLQGARRLLVRYQLVTDETVTAEFSLGLATRAALQRVRDRCRAIAPSRQVVTAIEPDAGQVFLESVVDEKPEVLSGPPLEYPDLLRQAGIQGRVLVRAIIDTMGRAEPESVRIIQSPNTGFDEGARSYVLRARFRPARVHGRAVRVLINLPIDYSIRR